MTNTNIEHIYRVLPLTAAEGVEKTTFVLSWSVPGTVYSCNEPELTLIDAAASALQNEICVELTLEQTTYYVGTEAGTVEKAVTSHRLTTMIPVANARPGQRVQLETAASIQGAWTHTSDEARVGEITTLHGTCMLEIAYVVVEEQEVHITKPTGLDGEAMADGLAIESVCGRFEKTLDLALSLTFEDDVDADSVITGGLANIKAVPMCGWIKVEGDISAEIHRSGEDSRPETFVFPFAEYIEVPEASAQMIVEATGRPEFLLCRQNGGENVCLLRGLLHLKGRLTRVEPLQVTALARSHQSFVFPAPHPGHHKPHLGHHQEKPFLLEEVVGAGSSQTLIQRELFFRRPIRMVREPVDARVRNLSHEIIPNKVIVRGVLHKQLFVVDAETGTVFAHDVDENFVHFVDVPGASPGMRAHVSARVEFVKVDIHPGGETARQVSIIEVTVKVTRVVKKGIGVSPLPPGAPGHHKPVKPPETIYIVRSGDTIWKIANMFGVSMEAIIRANNLANPNLIFPGQKLIIPR